VCVCTKSVVFGIIQGLRVHEKKRVTASKCASLECCAQTPALSVIYNLRRSQLCITPLVWRESRRTNT